MSSPKKSVSCVSVVLVLVGLESLSVVLVLGTGFCCCCARDIAFAVPVLKSPYISIA